MLDFGIAKLKEARIDHAFENDFTLTAAGMVVGTPAYVSPNKPWASAAANWTAAPTSIPSPSSFIRCSPTNCRCNADSEEQFVVAHATIAPDDILST